MQIAEELIVGPRAAEVVPHHRVQPLKGRASLWPSLWPPTRIPGCSNEGTQAEAQTVKEPVEWLVGSREGVCVERI